MVGGELRLKLVPLIAWALFRQAPAQPAPVCANCHPAETARYLESAMGKSLGPADPLPAGRVKHERSGSVITIAERGPSMVHSLVERGLTAEYDIAYQIGAGKLAHSYVVEINGYLFESPVTWFRAYGWDVSPGYARAPALDFDRPINETCLFCHAGAVSFAGGDGRKLADNRLMAITCERCHGPSEDHVRRPSVRNIVNPEKLGNRARDSVCEQCHLEGAARILNPGMSWKNFHPGENFEQTAAVYVFKENGHDVRPVSQVEQMASSKCALQSGGKLWCGSCHKAHSRSEDRGLEIRQVCASCHTALSKAAHPRAEVVCVSCHMPRLATEYAHVAVTDHRLLRRPGGQAEEGGAGSKTLGAWIEPPAEFRQRGLILANVTVGHRLAIPAIRLTGLRMLDALPASRRNSDSALLGSACDALLDQGTVPKAVELCRLAAEKQPESADRAMALGIALNRSGDFAGGERQLKNAIRLDSSLKHAYVELWTLYDRQKKTREMTETGDRFLQWNPKNIMFRVLEGASAADSKPFLNTPK